MFDCNNVTCLDLFFEDEIKKLPKFSMGEMAAKVANYNFQTRFDTIVFANLMYLTAIQAFLNFYNGVVVIKSTKHVPNFSGPRPHVTQFVIVGEEAPELCDVIQWLIEAKYDNRAKFIIICTSSIKHECDKELIFEALGKYFIANVILLKLSDQQEPEVFTYFPVNPQSCWQHVPEKINMSYNCVNDNCFKFAFPEKFDDLYGCSLRISTFQQPPYMLLENSVTGLVPRGSDGDILTSIVSLLNASLVMITPTEGPDWGHFQNNNWTGSLGDVFNHRAHGSMCSTPLSPSKYGNFQISDPYDSMDMVWAASVPDLKPSWEKLLYPLPVYLRFILFIIFIIIIFMNWFSTTKIWTNIARIVNIKLRNTNLLMYSWTTFLGMPVNRLPQNMALRITVYSWIWYCMIIRCVYQATLVGSMKLVVFEETLDNFSDVLLHNYPFGGLPSLREYYSDDPQVYDNWRNVEIAEAEEVLDQIALGRTDFVVALNRATIIEYLLKYNGARHLQILSEKIVNSPTVIYFNKNTHLSNPVNKLLTIVFENGFSQMQYARYIKQTRMFTEQKTKDAEPLRLVHFSGSLVLLMLGWLLSTIYFVIEIIFGRKMSNEHYFKSTPDLNT